MGKSVLRESVLENLLRSSAPSRAEFGRSSSRKKGLTIGRLVLLEGSGAARVDFRGRRSGKPVAARSTVVLRADDVGREVVLFFEEGDPERPVILGLLQRPGSREAVQVRSDRNRIVIAAEQEIVLQCGKASLTLTRAGKILIRGAYLSSQSSGVNRIKGGSVQIN